MRMTIPTRARVSAVLAAILAATSLATTAIAAPGQDAAAQAPRRSLLLFPVDVTASGVASKDEVSAVLTDVVASRLGASGLYTVMRFSPALAPVARLRMDQILTDADVQPPFSEDARKPIKIGKEASFDTVFVGSIDSYEYNDTDKQVSMVLSGRLLEVMTGKVLKSVIVNAASPKGGTAKEDEKALAAARSGGEELMTKLVPPSTYVTQATGPTTRPAEQPKPRKKARTDWIWGVLAVGLGLGIGLSSSGGGGGGGGGNDNPPPPPR